MLCAPSCRLVAPFNSHSMFHPLLWTLTCRFRIYNQGSSLGVKHNEWLILSTPPHFHCGSTSLSHSYLRFQAIALAHPCHNYNHLLHMEPPKRISKWIITVQLSNYQGHYLRLSASGYGDDSAETALLARSVRINIDHEQAASVTRASAHISIDQRLYVIAQAHILTAIPKSPSTVYSQTIRFPVQPVFGSAPARPRPRGSPVPKIKIRRMRVMNCLYESELTRIVPFRSEEPRHVIGIR